MAVFHSELSDVCNVRGRQVVRCVLSYESENTGQERSGALTELKLTTSETVTLHVGAVYQVLLCMF